MSQFNPNRRALFRRFAKPVQSVRLPAPKRPPQALLEAEFIKRCDGCMACANACPHDLIGMSDHLAVLSNPEPCDNCQSCVKACPTGALEQELLIAKINTQCDPLMARYCGSCQAACPEQAISLESSQYPQINGELCNGCGACAEVCEDFAIAIVAR